MAESLPPKTLHSPHTGEAETLVPVLSVELLVELRRLAARCLDRERGNDTLQPMALVQEAYLRLAVHAAPEWKDRARFLSVAACVMRQVLIEHARARKRGAG